jgi:hypothetical protein
MISHVDRIRPRDHFIAFGTGATICLGATLSGVFAFLAYASKRNIP